MVEPHSNSSGARLSSDAPLPSGAPLRVLQIASGDLWAGAEVQLFNLCEQLNSSDQVDLCVVLLNEGQLAERLREIGVEVTIFDEAGTSFWRIYTKLVAHCREFAPDIIHSHRQKENVLTALCGLRTGVPSIRTAHGAPEFEFSRFSARYLVALLDRWAGRFLQRRVVAVSDDLAQKLAEHYPASHIEVIRNGVALSEPIVDTPASLAGEQTHIGIVGRLVPVKRIDLFLETAALLITNETEQRLRFWIIGDGPLREQCEAQAQSLGITERIEFVGHVPSAMPYLQVLDLLVMCSDHEGTPMTLLEAMRCELPIVAHDVGGLRELLEGGECGYLVKSHTAEGYARSIGEVMRSSKIRQSYTKKGLQRLQKNYSAEKGMRAYVSLYQQVLNER